MKNKPIYIVIAVLLAITVFSCSTKKNTAFRRFYHNTSAHYNVYFNGYESFKEGVKKIDDMKENYTVLLPIYKSETEQAKGKVNTEMDRAIKKSAKMIKLHSITVKPKMKVNRNKKMTKKEKEWYKKNEYNKWIDDGYLLIGKANYYEQEYIMGMKSLQLIVNKYKKESTRFDAMYWIARSYSALHDFKTAESYLKLLKDDKKHPEKLDFDIDLAYADMYIKQKKYQKAITKLETIVDKTSKRKRARLKYILAQLYQKNNQDAKAMQTYAEVIKMNPPYDMAFSAKISMAKSYNAGSGGSKKLKKTLLKMLRDDKNYDYQDQIYFALADIEMKDENEAKAVEYYKMSIEKSISNANQKALSFLALADIYFKRPDYLNSGAYYDSAMTALDKKYPDYDIISKKAGNLRELITNLNIISNQDSLQIVAKMDSVKRIEYINNIIAQVKAKEQADRQGGVQQYDPNSVINNNNQAKGKWIMYNPQALSLGRTEFVRLWGRRKLEDHWRRRNKTVISNIDDDEDNNGKDSTGRVTDNKKVEYYLQDLPLNDSLIAISNQKIAKAYFDAGIVYEKKMEDYKEAEKSYKTLIKRFPKNSLIVEAYFNMYLINYKHTKNNQQAEYYRQKILKEFPYSKYANILSDPNYLKKLAETKDKVNLYYSNAYEAYNKKDYDKVLSETNSAILLSPKNDLMPKFLYLKAMSVGNKGNIKQTDTLLSEIIKKYPEDDITARAKDVRAMIRSGKYDPNYYKFKENDTYYYDIVIKNDKKVKNRVKFVLGNYNVDAFPKTKFKFKFQKLGDDKMQVIVKSFKTKADAEKYIKGIVEKNILSKFNPKDYEHFIISKTNYAKLQKLPIIDKYIKFYKAHYLFQ